MPVVQHIVETALYVDDLDKAEAFYGGVLGLRRIGREDGRHLFFAVGDGVLLLFVAAETAKGTHLPAHGATGPSHAALGIVRDSVDEWRRLLAANSVLIEQEVCWPLGGYSLYFRDPASNLVELVTPGCWGLPSGW